jgi:hypothetical protein
MMKARIQKGPLRKAAATVKPAAPETGFPVEMVGVGEAHAVPAGRDLHAVVSNAAYRKCGDSAAGSC